MILIRYFDIVLLIVALPVFLIGGLPMLGYAAGAGAWLVQRALQIYLNRKARRGGRPARHGRDRRRLHDRTRMARSAYDLRRRA